jgi:APA family basic amino acid/polyamine antiporter
LPLWALLSANLQRISFRLSVKNNILADLGFFKISAAQIASIILIVFLTAVNTLGVKEGKFIQTFFYIG